MIIFYVLFSEGFLTPETPRWLWPSCVYVCLCLCGPGTDNIDSDIQHMPEYLTVCAWRNVKEVSLLLGQLTSTAPVIDPSKVTDPDNEVTDLSSKVVDPEVVAAAENHDGLLTVDLVSEICFALVLVVVM